MMREAPIIQAAGILDAEEAMMLLQGGMDRLGFPLGVPVHREPPDEAATQKIIEELPRSSPCMLITYLDTADAIAELCRRMHVNAAQLHGTITKSELIKLRQLNPKLRISKSLVVRRKNLPELLRTVDELAPLVDEFITDTYDPVTGASGATGKIHDWEISRRLVEHSPRPVILAGGLTAENVREAIVTVRPVGVDTHTGIEGPDGRKIPRLVEHFTHEAKTGFSLT